MNFNDVSFLLLQTLLAVLTLRSVCLSVGVSLGVVTLLTLLWSSISCQQVRWAGLAMYAA